MKPYTQDEVVERLDDSYASNPTAESSPSKPDDLSYREGATPLDTLPAAWWNWFILHLLRAEARTSDAIADLYAELQTILADAGIPADSSQHDQLLRAIKAVTVLDVISQLAVIESNILLKAPISNPVFAGTPKVPHKSSAPVGDGTLIATDFQVKGVLDRVVALEENVGSVGDFVPPEASASNQLADKQFVIDSINSTSTRYLTTVSGSPFATRSALLAGPWYYQGSSTSGTLNDYAVVTADESHTGEQWSYVFDGVNWDDQYKVNSAPFSTQQQASIDSGITSTLVTKLTNLPEKGALDSTYVGVSNTQTITGSKTFQAEPILPAASGSLMGSTVTNKAATRRQVSDTVAALAGTSFNITGIWTCPTPAMP